MPFTAHPFGDQIASGLLRNFCQENALPEGLSRLSKSSVALPSLMLILDENVKSAGKEKAKHGLPHSIPTTAGNISSSDFLYFAEKEKKEAGGARGLMLSFVFLDE